MHATLNRVDSWEPDAIHDKTSSWGESDAAVRRDFISDGNRNDDARRSGERSVNTGQELGVPRGSRGL